MTKSTKATIKPLPTLLHLRTAAAEGRSILVFQDGELTGSGRIDAIKETEEGTLVTLIEEKGMRYVFGSCSFGYMNIRRSR